MRIIFYAQNAADHKEVPASRAMCKNAADGESNRMQLLEFWQILSGFF